MLKIAGFEQVGMVWKMENTTMVVAEKTLK
jgi:hypothetical protein